MARRSARHRQIRRIGLLSPCSGNLGNAAIMSAMIANIRERIPGVEILGITLSPDDTRSRHGIQTFPITGVARPFYTLCSTPNSESQPRIIPRFQGLKRWAKKIPLLETSVKAIRRYRQEFVHIRASARVVRNLDRLIIPGGGPMDEFWGGPWGHPWSLFKWGVLARVYGVPLQFVSIGRGALESRLGRFFMRVALGIAEYRSYRDNESKIVAQSLLDARNDLVYPDLAFSYPYPTFPPLVRDASPPDRLVVGVSPIDYCDPRAWPIKDAKRYDAYVSTLAQVVKWILNEGHQVFFFWTDGPDVAAIDDIQAIVSGNSTGANLIPVLVGPPRQNTDGLLEGIRHADLIIASRLHGVILSHLSGIPVLALSYDPKIRTHMDEIGSKEFCLEVDDMDSQAIIERFAALRAALRRESDHIRAARLRLRRELDPQYDLLLGAKPSSSTSSGLQQEETPAAPPSFQMI
ncbi:MAG: polysaccharide pyruvyl transferase family protein [Candidatus Acidiferrales bacterium]